MFQFTLLQRLRSTEHRDRPLDLVRGFLVLFMSLVLSAITLIPTETLALADWLQNYGLAFGFTALLFISGTALALSHFAPIPQRGARRAAAKEWKHCFLRLGQLLFALYLTMLLELLLRLPQGEGVDLMEILKAIFTLQQLSPFTALLLPFVLCTLLFTLGFSVWQRISQSSVLTLEATYFFYLIGYTLSTWEAPEAFLPYQSWLAGTNEVGIFPLFTAWPIFLLGLYFGQLLLHRSTSSSKGWLAANWLLITLFSSIGFHLFYQATSWEPFNILNLWPLSLSWIGLSLAVFLLMYLLFLTFLRQTIAQNHGQEEVRRPFSLLLYLGQHAYDFFLFQLVSLSAIWLMEPNGLVSLNELALATLISFTLSWLATAGSITFNRSWIPRFSLESRPQHLSSLRSLVFTAVFISLTLFTLFTEDRNWQQQINQRVLASPGLPTISSDYLRTGTFPWYDNSFPHFIQLEVVNEDGVELMAGESVELLLGDQPINPTLVYFSREGYQPVPFNFSVEESGNTLSFNLEESIPESSRDNRYFLYSGRSNQLSTESTFQEQKTRARYSVLSREQQTKSITASINRRWFLASYPRGVEVEPMEFYIELQDLELLEAVSQGTEDFFMRYELTNSSETVVESGDMPERELGQYHLTFDPTVLPPDQYQLQAKMSFNGSEIFAEVQPFTVSHPIYVAWTLDWEGWDVPDSYLLAIENQARRHYDIPLTQFFNPRIYLPSVLPPERAQHLTNWVKNRPNDEVQLHLHMWKDMVQAAGVTPRSQPTWGFIGDGYDVRTDSYGYDEFNQIVAWAENQMAANGLGFPVGYRAGGWFADEEVLWVLNDRGYLYESSGREHVMWNGAGRSPWNLNSRSQPYHPARDDQNRVGAADAMRLLEIPNNGGDTYGYTSGEMIQRFRDNYYDTPLTEPRTVNFLTHPQWHDEDEATMEEVLNYTSDRLYERDRGPVIYATLGEIYEIWNRK